MRSGNKSYNRHQILILLYPSSNLLPTLKQYFSAPSKFIYHSAFFTAPYAVLIQATTIIAEWLLCPSPSPQPSIPCSMLFDYSALPTLPSVIFPGHIRHAPARLHLSFPFSLVCMGVSSNICKAHHSFSSEDL